MLTLYAVSKVPLSVLAEVLDTAKFLLMVLTITEHTIGHARPDGRAPRLDDGGFHRFATRTFCFLSGVHTQRPERRMRGLVTESARACSYYSSQQVLLPNGIFRSLAGHKRILSIRMLWLLFTP